MNKYFILYRVPVETMQKWMAETPAEEMKAQGEKLGQDMQAWMATLGGAIIEKGQPLGKTKRVTKDGIADVKNDLNFYQIIEAESHDAAAQMVKDNPHFIIPDSFIDVMEIPQMGM